MKSKKMFSIEKPLFVTPIDETGRTGERESRDTLVVNYTDGSHAQNQRETPKDLRQKSNTSSDLCAPFMFVFFEAYRHPSFSYDFKVVVTLYAPDGNMESVIMLLHIDG